MAFCKGFQRLLLLVLLVSLLCPAALADDLVLVNEWTPLPEEYMPMDLVSMETEGDLTVFSLETPDMLATWTALLALNGMLADATDKGQTGWQVSAAYRSVQEQQAIWDDTYNKYLTQNDLPPDKALQATQRRVAVPGCSEHHTGLAFDLTIPGKSFRLTKQCAWLAKNCWRYGFIIRYTKAKEKITGITEEPWHIRYVGLEAAETMYKKKLCLEEYLEKYGEK